MEDEYEVITLTNNDGEDEEFEVILSFEVENNDYVALLPVVGKYGKEEVLLFKVTADDEETTFMPIEDEEEFEIVAESYYEFIEE
jgi:uncharacterized protein YrzB (UPF0473 family)